MSGRRERCATAASDIARAGWRPPPHRPAQHARAVRVNITLPEDVLAEVDKEAGRQGLSRSAFLARAARRAMNEAA